MKKKVILTIIVMSFIWMPVYAQSHGYGCINQMELISAKGITTSEQSYKPSTEILPVLGKYARNNKRSISYPFGIELHSMFFDQKYTASGLKLQSDSTDIFARADTLYQNTSAYEFKGSVRPNIWILPFLNVYGIFGYTKGMIKPNLTVPYIVLQNVPVFDTLVVDTTFEIHDDIGYVGPTYGVGATFSIGYRYLFLVADYNYSITDPTDLDDNLQNHTFSPKIGVLLGKNKKIKGAFWLGAMYIKNDQRFEGKIDVEEINPMFVPLLGKEATYSGEITAVNRWNFVVGGSININNHHFITLEAGVVDRKQFSLGYNFNF